VSRRGRAPHRAQASPPTAARARGWPDAPSHRR
jgi:hypothetical protein